MYSTTYFYLHVFGSYLGLTHRLLTDQDARDFNLFTFLGTLSSFASSVALFDLLLSRSGITTFLISQPLQLYEILPDKPEWPKPAQRFGFSVLLS